MTYIKEILKSCWLLVLCLIAARFIGFPANFTPILACAVFLPFMTDNKYIQMFLPVGILIVTDPFLGLYSAIFIAILMISNFLTSKYGKVNVTYLIVISVSLLIYKLPIIIQFDASYWLANLLISIIINFFLFVLFKRVSK